MNDVDIKLNHRGVRDLLRSSEVRRDLERRAAAIAASAGPGHRIESEDGPNRARAAVVTDTFEAMNDEATSRSLTRAIGAGR